MQATNPIQADDLFKGRVWLLVPHYDDEALACGGVLALARDPQNIGVAYVTRGDSPAIRGAGGGPPDIGAIRRKESLRALAMVGIEESATRHFDIPEGEVRRETETLRTKIREVFAECKPDTVLIPFRCDQHEEHVVLNRVAREVATECCPAASLFEYFVYRHFPLLPRKYIRHYLKPEHLLDVDIRPVRERKHAMLNCFASQTTLFYPGQCRPVLGPGLIEEYCSAPESFVRSSVSDGDLFLIAPLFIRLAQWLQPRLKRLKEEARARFAGRKNAATAFP